MSYTAKRNKTREDETGSLYALVYYKFEGNDLEYCCSHEDWAVYELAKELAELGIPDKKINDFQIAVREAVYHENALDEQCN